MLRQFLQALDEAALILDRAGVIHHANAPALRLFGRSEAMLIGQSFAELTAEPPAALLRRFAGSSQPAIGSLQLRDADGATRKIHCRGCRIAGMDEPLLLVRLEPASHERFKALTEKIVALNGEIRRNRRIQLQLEAALEQKETLLRELHHRVKNNLQTLLGILSIAEQRAVEPKARDAIRDARMRVEAMAVLQRLLYQRGDLARVDGAAFLAELCQNIERAFRRPGITVRVLPTSMVMSLDLAAAVGLIVNELLTNAFRHAFQDRERGEVTVQLSNGDGASRVVLSVTDDGHGLPPTQTSGTGLMLVRGLARQHDGTCAIESAGGVRCVITLRERLTPPPAVN